MDNTRLLKDRIFKIVIITFALITASPIVLIITKLIKEGYKQLSFNFLIENTPDTFAAMTATAAGEKIPGGIANGIIGSLLMIVIAAAIAIPFGIIDRKSTRLNSSH